MMTPRVNKPIFNRVDLVDHMTKKKNSGTSIELPEKQYYQGLQDALQQKYLFDNEMLEFNEKFEDNIEKHIVPMSLNV